MVLFTTQVASGKSNYAHCLHSWESIFHPSFAAGVMAAGPNWFPCFSRSAALSPVSFSGSTWDLWPASPEPDGRFLEFCCGWCAVAPRSFPERPSDLEQPGRSVWPGWTSPFFPLCQPRTYLLTSIMLIAIMAQFWMALSQEPCLPNPATHFNLSR